MANVRASGAGTGSKTGRRPVFRVCKEVRMWRVAAAERSGARPALAGQVRDAHGARSGGVGDDNALVDAHCVAPSGEHDVAHAAFPLVVRMAIRGHEVLEPTQRFDTPSPTPTHPQLSALLLINPGQKRYRETGRFTRYSAVCSES